MNSKRVIMSELPSYTVIGNPIAHSLSPYIQDLFSKATGIVFHYDRTLAPLDEFGACVNALVASKLMGANVTRPFKFEALKLATHVTNRAKLAGAANTLRFDITPDKEGKQKVWWADNTDGIGLVRDITCNAGVALDGKKVLLIGAGGAAAGVIGVLLEARPQLLMVLNRTPERAKQLVYQYEKMAALYNVDLLSGALDENYAQFDVVINSSSSSQDGYTLPVSSRVLSRNALVVDMTYGNSALPFLRWAKEHGAHGRDGLGMLVEQSAESFFFWHGVLPSGRDVLQQARQELNIGLSL